MLGMCPVTTQLVHPEKKFMHSARRKIENKSTFWPFSKISRKPVFECKEELTHRLKRRGGLCRKNFLIPRVCTIDLRSFQHFPGDAKVEIRCDKRWFFDHHLGKKWGIKKYKRRKLSIIQFTLCCRSRFSSSLDCVGGATIWRDLTGESSFQCFHTS